MNILISVIVNENNADLICNVQISQVSHRHTKSWETRLTLTLYQIKSERYTLDSGPEDKALVQGRERRSTVENPAGHGTRGSTVKIVRDGSTASKKEERKRRTRGIRIRIETKKK